MATPNSISDKFSSTGLAGSGILVLLAAMPADQLETAIANLSSAFPAEDLLVAAPDMNAAEQYPFISLHPYTDFRPLPYAHRDRFRQCASSGGDQRCARHSYAGPGIRIAAAPGAPVVGGHHCWQFVRSGFSLLRSPVESGAC